MTDETGGYGLADYVPFTAEVYFRLIEAANAGYWPLHLAGLAVGALSLALVLRRRTRTALALVAASWLWVGVSFLAQRYAVIHWAGDYLGLAFILEAALLLLLAVTGRGLPPPRSNPAQAAGMLLAMTVLLAYPFIAPLTGRGYLQAEAFGLHPDPTAMVTVGLCVAALRGGALWTAVLVPGLWCLFSGLTLLVLGAPWAGAPLACAALAVVGPAWASLAWRRSLEPP